MERGLPLVGVRSQLTFINKYVFRLKKMTRVGIHLRFLLSFLIMRPKSYFQAATGVVQWVLWVSRSRKTKCGRDIDHSGHGIARNWYLHSYPGRRAKLAL